MIPSKAFRPVLTRKANLTVEAFSHTHLPVPAVFKRFLHKIDSESEPSLSKEKDPTEDEAIKPPQYPAEDWIGPVDNKSNLNRIRFAQPEDETKIEERYRLLRQATHMWNQEFWSNHNEKFVKAKQKFTEGMFMVRGQTILSEDGTKRVLTPEELAEFYTEFLEQNREIFRAYNREWYKRNIYMLWPALCVAVVKSLKRFRRMR